MLVKFMYFGMIIMRLNTYVTGFVKIDPNRTRTEIHFIAEH